MHTNTRSEQCAIWSIPAAATEPRENISRTRAAKGTLIVFPRQSVCDTEPLTRLFEYTARLQAALFSFAGDCCVLSLQHRDPLQLLQLPQLPGMPGITPGCIISGCIISGCITPGCLTLLLSPLGFPCPPGGTETGHLPVSAVYRGIHKQHLLSGAPSHSKAAWAHLAGWLLL